MASELKEWLVMLGDKQAPVFSHIKQQILATLDDENRSAADTRPLVISDPGMAANLCKIINGEREKAGRLALTTMGGVIAQLGVTRLRAAVEQMETFEEFKLNELHQTGVDGCIEQSWYTRQFAMKWATDRGVREPEEIELAAILQCLPELLLWVYSGKTMPTINYRAYCLGENYHAVVQNEMGCLKREIGSGLAESWFLPELAGFGFESHYGNHTHATAIALAALLARIVQHGVYGEDMDAFYQNATIYFGREEHHIARDLHQFFLQLAPLEVAAGYRPLAGLLTSTTREKIREEKYCLPEHKKSAEKKPQAEVQQAAGSLDKAGYFGDIEKLKQLISQKASFDQLINHALNTLHGPVHLQRVCFLLLNKEKTRMVSRVKKVRTADETTMAQKLEIDLKTKSLFVLLMKKPQSFFLSKENYDKYWSTIPGSVKTVIGVESFLAGSVFYADKPIGMFYADNLNENISENKHKAFQQLVTMLNKALQASVLSKA